MSITVAVRDLCLYDTDPVTGRKELIRSRLLDLAKAVRDEAAAHGDGESFLVLFDPSRRQLPEDEEDRKFADEFLPLLGEGFTETDWVDTRSMAHRLLDSGDCPSMERNVKKDREAPVLLSTDAVEPFLTGAGEKHTGFVILEEPFSVHGWQEFLAGEEPDVPTAVLDLFSRCVPLSGVGRLGMDNELDGKLFFSIDDGEAKRICTVDSLSDKSRVHVQGNPHRVDLRRSDAAGEGEWPITLGIIPCTEDPYRGYLYIEGCDLPDDVSTDRALLAEKIRGTCRKRGVGETAANAIADAFAKNVPLNMEVIHEAS